MARNAAPITALALALAWLSAQIFNSWIIAAITIAATLALGCGGAGITRAPRGLAVVATGTGCLTLCFIFILRYFASGAEVLILQVGFLAILAPVVPLAYALTFLASKPDRTDS